MTLPQIISLASAVIVAGLYLRDFVPEGLIPAPPKEPPLLLHLKNIIAVRDAYRNPEVATRCNALMEALLGMKQ